MEIQRLIMDNIQLDNFDIKRIHLSYVQKSLKLELVIGNHHKLPLELTQRSIDHYDPAPAIGNDFIRFLPETLVLNLK